MLAYASQKTIRPLAINGAESASLLKLKAYRVQGAAVTFTLKARKAIVSTAPAAMIMSKQ